MDSILLKRTVDYSKQLLYAFYKFDEILSDQIPLDYISTNATIFSNNTLMVEDGRYPEYYSDMVCPFLTVEENGGFILNFTVQVINGTKCELHLHFVRKCTIIYLTKQYSALRAFRPIEKRKLAYLGVDHLWIDVRRQHLDYLVNTISV